MSPGTSSWSCAAARDRSHTGTERGGHQEGHHQQRDRHGRGTAVMTTKVEVN